MSHSKVFLYPIVLCVLMLASCDYTKNNDKAMADTLAVNEVNDTNTLSAQKNIVISNNQERCFPVKWSNVSDINDRWVALERDIKGYLVYKPCNGSTPRITIDSGMIIVQWQLDAPEKLQMEKFTSIKDKDGIFFLGYNNEIEAQFEAVVVDSIRHLVLWNWTMRQTKQPHERVEYKWVTTPAKYEKEFRLVDNPCPTEMKEEKSFLPVEFN